MTAPYTFRAGQDSRRPLLHWRIPLPGTASSLSLSPAEKKTLRRGARRTVGAGGREEEEDMERGRTLREGDGEKDMKT